MAIALWIKSDDLTKQINDFLNRQRINEYEAFKQNTLSCTKTHNKESCKKLIAMAQSINDGGGTVEDFWLKNHYAGIASRELKDYTNAIKYFQQACEIGYAASCNYLGSMYSNGKETKKDIKKANKYFQLACDGKDAYGCLNLGTSYYYGEGVKQSYSQAFKHFQQAKESKIAESHLYFMLGIMYLEGQGCRLDKDEALEHFGIACDMGNDTACKNYAIIKQ
ncbi:tetratricopeptide repeat protein [Helicobacter sp. UBA3407]|uniref:tetratricopeptide repeat protein n=1 Tax=Helicobacter TaxID=209 RepID=UPI0026152105|nr:tetratricopeptide repeat protein [Helicobacter sp. UBA3407]